MLKSNTRGARPVEVRRRLALSVIGRLMLRLERLGFCLTSGPRRASPLARFLADLLRFPADLHVARHCYHNVFGAFPRLLFPQTFNEHLQRNKFVRRRWRHTMLADKLAARAHVAAVIGRQYLNALIWHGNDLRTADRSRLPTKFAIKANHASGLTIIVQDIATLDWTAAHETTQGWLRTDYSANFAEWQYRWITPTIFIEELIEVPDGSPLIDYKFFCFYGRAEFVQLDFDRYTRHSRLFCDRNFDPLPFACTKPPHTKTPLKPARFGEMLEAADTLATKEAFLRVDLYDVGRVLFGELTLTPQAGHGQFVPKEWDERIGRLCTHRK